MASHNTCLRWGPVDHSLPALIDFQAEIARYLEHARQRAAENVFYARMISHLEHELIAVSDRIVTKRKPARRRKPAA